jgi:hypothetical protein
LHACSSAKVHQSSVYSGMVLTCRESRHKEATEGITHQQAHLPGGRVHHCRHAPVASDREIRAGAGRH